VLLFFLYLTAASSFSFLLGSFFIGRNRKLIIFFGLIILLTPSQVSINPPDYAPAIFVFLFNLILEQDYSLRILRPLVLSIPISLLVGLIVLRIRKKFF